MKIPPDKLAAFQREAEKMNTPARIELQRVAVVMGELIRRAADPHGRNDEIAARFAARLVAGGVPDEEAAELFALAADGALPPRFLDAVQRLSENPPGETRQRAYLSALLDYRFTHGRWPHAAAADRHAVECFPGAFAGIDTGEEGGKTLRRLRKSLGIDWLPEGRPGRPRK